MYSQINVKRLLKIAANTDGRFFILVEASNNKTYQVKFNITNQKSNINEFISNYVGKIINAPVLDGCFLTFTDEQLQNVSKKALERNPFSIIDMKTIKDNQFFGIEWQDSIIKLENNSELEVMLDLTNNRKNFFALYPYDQYLKNHDRHIGNHLILKKGKNKPMQYCIIDGDRIFDSLYWDKLDELVNNFDCLEIGVSWHKYLYSLVSENDYIFVLEYSLNINEIKEEEIKNLLDTISYVYNIDKNEYDTIQNYLQKRKKDFYSMCLNNSTCFPKIEQKRIG